MPESEAATPEERAVDVVRALSGPDDRVAVAAILTDWAMIFGIAYACEATDSWAAYVVGIWTIGIFQYAIYDGLVHEAAHRTLFSKRTWNDRLDFLYALPFFETLEQYRELHLDHHRFLGRQGDHLVEDYRYHGLPDDPRDMETPFMSLVVRPLLGTNAVYLFLDGGGSFRPFLWRGFRITAFWAAILFAGFLTGTLPIVFLYWLVPLLWCFPAYLFWAEVEDHYGAASGVRTCLGIKNLLTHNSGYHWVHHHYPSIPWYRLPEAHLALFPEGNSDITSGFLETYRILTSRGRALPLQPQSSGEFTPDAEMASKR